MCASLIDNPLAAHHVNALLAHVLVDDRGLVSLERFNVRRRLPRLCTAARRA